MIPKAAAVVCVLIGPLITACEEPPQVRVDMVVVKLVAQKQSWEASYLLNDATARSTEVPTGREVHVPLGAFVQLKLSSHDFVSDFQISDLALRDFTAPGLPSELVFHANRQGRFELRGEELCGRPHTDWTRGLLVVEDSGAFQDWVRRHMRRDHG